MRRLVTIMTMVLLGAVIAAVPSTAKSKFELGPKFGLNMARFIGDDAHSVFSNDGISNIYGFTGGVFVRFNVSNHLTLRPELLYNRKGSKFVSEHISNDTVSMYDVYVHLDYIEAPILACYEIPLGGGLNTVLATGPSVSFPVSSNLEIRLTETSDGETIVDDVQLHSLDIYNVKNIQMGWVFGAGFDLGLGRYGFTVESRYSCSLERIFHDVSRLTVVPEGYEVIRSSSEGPGAKLKNSVFSFMISFSYPLGN